MSCELLSHRHGAALVLSLSQPALRNALSEQAVSAGIEALNMAESDQALRCVVLRGDGDHFCAGWPRQDADPAAADLLQQFLDALRAFPKPVIAAVEGMAAGAGLAMALACDQIVAAEDASLGLSGAQPLPMSDRQVLAALAATLPRPQLQQLLWAAPPVGVHQWESWGWVSRRCGHGQALTVALDWAEQLAQAPAEALAAGKEQARRAVESASNAAAG